MSRKNLETLVLVLGLVVIGVAVFFIFIRQQTASSIFITNLIISLGFLIYVVYSIMATNNLNREIRALTKQVAALKADIGKKNTELETRASRISALEQEVASKDLELENARTQISTLHDDVAALKKQVENQTPPEPGQHI
jgi:peptidoglycan hydrolase CwlO-like protein